MIDRIAENELLQRIRELEAENQLLKSQLDACGPVEINSSGGHKCCEKGSENGKNYSQNVIPAQNDHSQTEILVPQGEIIEKERLYRQVFETAGDACMIHDCNGRLIEVGQKLGDMLGYSIEELTQMNVEDIDDSTHSLPFKQRFIQLREVGAQIFQTSLKRRNGDIVPVEVSASILDYRKGNACFVAIRDIRQRLDAERKLRESEERFRSLVENSPDLIMRFDRQYRHLFVNSASRSVLNKEPQSFIGLTHEEMGFPKKNCEFWEREMLSVFDDQRPRNVEFSLQKADEMLYFEWRLIPEFSEKGEVDTLLAVARDITKRKLAEKELVESETRLKLALDGASESLWDWYIKDQVIECNDQWFRMLGYEKKEGASLGQFIMDILHPDDVRKVKRAYQDHFKGITDFFEVEHRLRTADGTYIWLLERGKVVDRDERGRAVRALGTCVNINDLKEIEDKLREAIATKDKFFSIIAHDLKNPFNALLGFSSLLKDNGSAMDPEQFQECIDLIHSSANQGYNLLENLLEWSRSQMGKISWQPEKINLKNLLDSNLALHEAKAREKKITMTSIMPDSAMVFADEYMIDTVIRNLLSNALKFTYSGGTVEIIVKENSATWQIEVKDSGVGISRQNQDKLFRLDANYTRVGTNEEMGTGLGLVLCKEFVVRNNGQIWVESEPEKGSIFKFTLPKTAL